MLLENTFKLYCQQVFSAIVYFQFLNISPFSLHCKNHPITFRIPV
jgi:hypothetical protein